nr:ribosomal protein L32 [Causonis japonica]
MIQLPPFLSEKSKNTMMAPLRYLFIFSMIQQSQSFFLIRSNKIRNK